MYSVIPYFVQEMNSSFIPFEIPPTIIPHDGRVTKAALP